ncbi:MAG: hypothetical protein A2487_00850 [Candidatus Raymondbacteria bacterium RifOxyC12_full_50_8]|nr:MAG: hypothetical protein A2487_00850 [Candidatus Raymondbacteria bacterium RifOxyC12_full_50_8]OGP41098.1 MAG: hypothetical protein A2324_07335 [Candidatus Raymondbacteria bacterium RIFOXYB2_FULL_49_35]
MQTSGQANGYSYNDGILSITGLTTAQMKAAPNFSGWDFDTTWTIRTDSTYPGLKKLDNAPFAFSDYLIVGRTVALSELLANDYDIETVQTNLIPKIKSAKTGTTDSVNTLMFATSIVNGFLDTVTYRVGEVRSTSGDTLWGNLATSVLVLDTSTTATSENLSAAPNSFTLYQNSPNPFNPSTTIFYDVPKWSHVVLKVYDIAGQGTVTLMDGMRPAGKYQAVFNTVHLAGGVYFYRLVAGDFIAVKKMILMK